MQMLLQLPLSIFRDCMIISNVAQQVYDEPSTTSRLLLSMSSTLSLYRFHSSKESMRLVGPMGVCLWTFSTRDDTLR
jgi:hypothetical protein